MQALPALHSAKNHRRALLKHRPLRGHFFTGKELGALGHQLSVVPLRTGAFGWGQAVMSNGTGVHFGASEPRHDGAAIPEAPPVFGPPRAAPSR